MKKLRNLAALAALASAGIFAAACTDTVDHPAIPTAPQRAIAPQDTTTQAPRQESMMVCDSTAIPGTTCRSGGTIGGGG